MIAEVDDGRYNGRRHEGSVYIDVHPRTATARFARLEVRGRRLVANEYADYGAAPVRIDPYRPVSTLLN